MNNKWLIRDLKLEPVLQIMSAGSEDLSAICQARLLAGFDSVGEIYGFQKKLKWMILEPAKTEAIYRQVCSIWQEIIPDEEYLNPKYVGLIAPGKKLAAHLNICIRINRGLAWIYDILGENAAREKLEQQRKELEKLLSCGEKPTFELAGSFGEGFSLKNITLVTMRSEKKKQALFRKNHKQFSQGEDYRNIQSEVQKLTDEIALSLIKIISSYEKQIKGWLRNIHHEYGYGLGAIRLYKTLAEQGIPVCWPEFIKQETCFYAVALKELSLALKMREIKGNTIRLPGTGVTIITGANQGGKTTFIRSIGQAQLLAQSGLFVAADEYQTQLHHGVFTHFPDEEDKNLSKGLLDNELKKLDWIIAGMKENSLLLLNESFMTTTEQDGCEIGYEVLAGVLQTRIKAFFVTHNYLLARRMYEEKMERVLFLTAESEPEEERTYQMKAGMPQPLAHAMELYQMIVEEKSQKSNFE